MIDLEKYVPRPENKESLIFQNGDTSDIITAIQRIDRLCAKRRSMRKFAPLLRGLSDLKTCKNVWQFAVDNFEYQADKNHEKVKASNWLLYYRKGDCKSYSIAIIDILRELDYSCFYRFVSFDKNDSTPTHVFPVCRLKNGELIYLDAVPFSNIGRDFRFNEESNYTFYKDIQATSLTEGGGIGKIKYSF